MLYFCHETVRAFFYIPTFFASKFYQGRGGRVPPPEVEPTLVTTEEAVQEAEVAAA